MEPSEKTTKKSISVLIRQYPRGHVIAAGSLVLGLSLLMAFSSSEGTSSPRHSQSIELKLPTSGDTFALDEEPVVESQPFEVVQSPLLESETPELEPEPAALNYTTYTVKSGDSLSVLFKRAGLTDRDLYALIDQASEARALRKIMPGNDITFGLNAEGELEELVYQRDRLRSLRFSREDGVFTAEELERSPDVQVAYRRATIDSSLFLAGQRAGITDNLTMELAGIFGWDIDFILDIRRGDTFSVLFEEHFLDGDR